MGIGAGNLAGLRRAGYRSVFRAFARKTPLSSPNCLFDLPLEALYELHQLMLDVQGFLPAEDFQQKCHPFG